MRIGHKQAECTVQLVGEAQEEEEQAGFVEEREVEWTVGAVEAVEEWKMVEKRSPKWVRRKGGSDAVRPLESPKWKMEDQRWVREPEKGEVGPRQLTLSDYITPKRARAKNPVKTRNGFSILYSDEDLESICGECGVDDSLEFIGEVVDVPEESGKQDGTESILEVGEPGNGGELVGETVEVTIDSGASKSVWPRKRKGVLRRKGKTGVKLAAANGSPIEVNGEAALHFRREGRKCVMRFLDADVRRPLGSVSAIVDEGNSVVFSRRESYIMNDATGEKIPMRRKGGVFVIELEADETTGKRGVVMGAEEQGEKVFRRQA